ncbi:Secreted chorismate mutase [Orchesella cincta]|uniref:chorismate mutase n=1 Tax=Orchesella cincta TaxID=48709 RepID=A0A1D2N4H4_ORCCI|nr:Secreted chorismate mutase [Orchesella cincta]
MDNPLRYYLAISAMAYLLSSTTGSEEPTSPKPTSTAYDTHFIEEVDVHLKKEETEAVKVDLISLNSSTNSTDFRPFQCSVKGLTEEDLERLKSREDTVIVTVNGDEYITSSENNSDENVGFNGSQAFNVRFNIENDTVVINGELRANESDFGDRPDTNSNSSTSKCEISFYKEPGVVGHPPKILTTYNHIVLMNGAPDQVISCTSAGVPTPRMSWRNQRPNPNEGITALSTEYSINQPDNTQTSYLLFSEVNLNTSGNYTCFAENDLGSASQTFEVEVITVETLNTRCNDVQDGDDASSNHNEVELIFNQDINKVLSRSKRHLWYQWRGTKYHIPPSYNRPPPPPSSSTLVHTNLQKMINFITERLKLADKVAVNKWDNDKPVEDVPREQIILENMVRQAQSANLDGAWAHQFFRDQIEANKDIQFELIRTWHLQGRRPPGPPVDLTNEVRPQIDIINTELIALAQKTEYERREWKCRSEVERNARYATFLYDLDPLHQKALQKATSRLCITPRRNYYPF